MSPPDLPKLPDNVDPKWLPEWVSSGMAALDTYMAKQARFAQYLADHPSHDEEDS